MTAAIGILLLYGLVGTAAVVVVLAVGFASGVVWSVNQQIRSEEEKPHINIAMTGPDGVLRNIS